jgi:osmotically inducible lipoprotein OsmB
MRMTLDIGAMLDRAKKETVSALRRHPRVARLLVVAAVSLAGCGTSTADRALSGAGIGAGAGVIGGALFGLPVAGAAIGAAAGAGVGVVTAPAEATVEAPRPPDPPPNPDHVVTTYLSGARGPKAARVENRRVASRTCGGGFVSIDELSGVDANSKWLQLIYGCLAESQRGAAPPHEQTSGR